MRSGCRLVQAAQERLCMRIQPRYAAKGIWRRCSYCSTSRPNKPRGTFHISRQKYKWNIPVPKSAMRGMRLCTIRAIWQMAHCLIVVQPKAGGYGYRQAVSTTICGNLHVARSDRAVACNLWQRRDYAMGNRCPTCESMSIEEAPVSNM